VRRPSLIIPSRSQRQGPWRRRQLFARPHSLVTDTLTHPCTAHQICRHTGLRGHTPPQGNNRPGNNRPAIVSLWAKSRRKPPVKAKSRRRLTHAPPRCAPALPVRLGFRVTSGYPSHFGLSESGGASSGYPRFRATSHYPSHLGLSESASGSKRSRLSRTTGWPGPRRSPPGNFNFNRKCARVCARARALARVRVAARVRREPQSRQAAAPRLRNAACQPAVGRRMSATVADRPGPARSVPARPGPARRLRPCGHPGSRAGAGGPVAGG
jgi:hypothetical protein